MVELKNDFLTIENGYGIEMSGLCLVGVEMINCEHCEITNCEITQDMARRNE